MAEVYKIFIFESNTGGLLRTENYDDLVRTQQEVIDHNNKNPNNRINIYFGTQFPPPEVKYSSELKQFIQKSLSEQVADGEVIIPPDMKVVDDRLVRLTKRELVEKGMLVLEYDEKIDELDNIVKLSKKEMYDSGKMTKFQVYDHFIQELNLSVESKLKSFYNYPMQEMGTWQYKKDQSSKWIALDSKEKNDIIEAKKFLGFDILISESGIESLSAASEKISKIDALANKIISKYGELEKTYGEMFALRSSLKENLKNILNRDGINHYDEMAKELVKV